MSAAAPDQPLPLHARPPGADPERYKGTIKLVRRLVNAADKILAAARDRANRELVEAGRTIFEREFQGDESIYRTYGAQTDVFDRLGGDLERAPSTVRTWVEAAIVDRRLSNSNIQAPENALTMTHLLELGRLDADEEVQTEVARECIEKRWPTRWLSKEVTGRGARLAVSSRRKRRKQPSAKAAEQDTMTRGPGAELEDLRAVYEVVASCLGQRGRADRRAAAKEILSGVTRRLKRDQWTASPGTASVAALHRELVRVYNGVNAGRRSQGRTESFEAVVGPGPLVTIRLGDWKRACEPEALMPELRRIPDANKSANAQRIGRSGTPGTLADKLREVQAVVDRAAKKTWS